MRHGDNSLPGRLAAACAVRPLHMGAGRHLVHAQGAVHVFPVRDGQGHCSTLSLRSAHASRVEGVSAVVARDGGDRCCRHSIRRARDKRDEMRMR